ncbi:amidase [Rhodoferax sp.]|uniref:amidase n=1 Tax=Rhodoferax sp. TaxID=50421 RepID=UPI00261100D7|nr:amidase [Rhodoferax sp.]MDD2918483.1 amidase [Rhodoferax sp.]
MNAEWAFKSALELSRAIASRQLSPVALMHATLAQAERLDPGLNCFATYAPEQALAAAKRAEQAVMSGQPIGPLHGLPISVKDLIAVKDLPFSSGSRAMAGNVASVNAPSVERILAAGACIIGKTTTSEFGCKAVGDSPLTGITRNPWDTRKTPGGSSAGAAASVAAGITPLALGTDGGGSIRIPASLCGLFGIKAQFGRVPVYPVAATPTLAHVGPLTRTVRDAALLLSVISGHDLRDPFSVAGPVPDYLGACDLPVKGMRIAWSRTLGYARPDPEVVAIAERAARVFTDLGCEVVEIDKVLDEDPVAMWTSEFYAGVGVRLKRQLAEQRELLDPAVADMLKDALAQSSEAYYTQVFRRYELRDKMRLFFERFDLLLTPTLPCAAFDVGLNTPPGLPDRNIVDWVFYTYPFNLTGQPAASIPAGLTRTGLPVGLQIVARSHHETDIFRAAAALEASQPWRYLSEATGHFLGTGCQAISGAA